MAETSAWAHAARLSDARKMEQIEQLLRGAVAATNGSQQRSLSSGRHPRLGGGNALQGQHQAASGAFYGDLGGPQATGQSPRPRSVSVGRRHLQDMHELVNVMHEISSTGQEIRNMARRSQEQQQGLLGDERRMPGGSSSTDGRASAGPGSKLSGSAATATAASGRGYTTTVSTGAASSAAGGSSIVGGLRGAPSGGGTSASGKGVARSILGGVESLTTKLEMLGGRLTPRKASPRAEQQRDTSVGRRNLTSSGDGPNLRDMLAEVNAGLLQGSRDQRPSAPSAASLVQGARHMAFDPASRRVSAASGGGGGGAAAGLYGSTAASLILADRHQRAEDMLAADRLLEDLHAQIRSASSALRLKVAEARPLLALEGRRPPAGAAAGRGVVPVALLPVAACCSRSLPRCLKPCRRRRRRLYGAHLLTDRSTAGGVSESTADLDATLGQQLRNLDRLTRNIGGLVTPETESSTGSAGVTSAGGGGEASSSLLAMARLGDRRDAPTVAAAATAIAAGSGPLRRNGTAAPFMLGPKAAWLEDAVAATSTPPGSNWTSATVGAIAGGAPLGLTAGAAAPVSARGDGKPGVKPSSSHHMGSSGAGGSGAGSGGAALAANNNVLPHHQLPPGASQGSRRPEEGVGLDGLNMAFLMQQRNKEKTRREELGAAEAAVAAARARQEAAQMQAQHDTLVTRYLAERQRVELSDVAANTAAQLRDLQSQVQDARAREEVMRRQMEHTAAAMSDQAAAGARQRTTVELALQEFLNLLESASSSSSSSSATGSLSGGRGSGQSGVGSHQADLESLIDAMRLRLREHGDIARRQREMLEAMEAKLAEERAAAAAAREAACSERTGAVTLATQQATFQKDRAETLQREMVSKLEARVRQVEDERERALRQRDTAEMSLQAQHAQLEAAQKQQDTLVGRLYDGQRAREDAEVLQAQIRSLGRQLEEARAAADRSDALECRVVSEREAREELDKLIKLKKDAKLAALQSQLTEREAALESSRRRIRELESAANSAVSSRQVATEEVSKRSAEVRTLTTENARMFHLLEKLQQEKRAADAEVQKLTAQVLTLQQDAAALRTDLAATRDQLNLARESNVVRDATLAQHHLSADLAAARSEAAALRAAHEAAGEYAQAMARSLRQHGLTPPPPPSSADVTSHIGELQVIQPLPTPPKVGDGAKLATESNALAEARAEASELRQQLSDARTDIERLRRESQSLAERYSQLESAHAVSQQSWQHSASVDATALHKLTQERDELQLQLHSMQVAGNQDADELRRKLMRMEVQVESLSSSKREAEERIRVLTQDLGTLRKALGDKEAQMEAMRLALEDAKRAAAQAAEMQHQAEAQVAQAERARLAAVAEADKARSAMEAERARAAAAAEAEAARAREEAAVAVEKEKARLAEEAEKARADAAEELAKQAAELSRMQSEVERLEKDLEDRNAEYAGLYDYCSQMIGERNTAIEERDALSASAASVAAEVAALRQEVEELREDLADKEQRLAVKPKMAELQYRINELSAQVADLTTERDAAVAETNQLTVKLQEETEAHFQTDGRRVRLGEEVERLRGILKMYSIPF
ncbi:hypothetical protein VOLCADRAFT_95833 [Volvox carteri f. nagariensis]|uniref:Uncharacterized protein n=1 Tax=Volvox carteri f. nagariensis TaxID=3068 RepID=D8U8H8_VOLCA|nr:uncharacterized protein VOLCADRAFT_95833 [Volvox carteri f. nagariensis]EFJ43926.1 hypothetical protein VOLCADRAFT_95833 [Volvox carteri f. nagariensis]|eukprot:XP_002954938.1 hypothetical protein VOLCADRAFT_95833 [Volvox carteri f. nagariensis]